MTFRRTSSGLSNQHLFLGVDTVVFVEGGRSYSKEEAYLNQFNSSSIDIQFWQGIFKFYYPKIKYEFRAIGSKTTLLDIASDIRSGSIDNVLVAMDRDNDKINNKLVMEDGIFYTYGYSWENDVWCLDVIEKVYLTLCVDKAPAIRKKIKAFTRAFERDIYSFVSCDIFLSTDGKALFPRKNNAASFITLDANKKPSANLSYVQNLIDQSKLNRHAMKCYGKKLKVRVDRDCYGHLWAEFCYRLLTYLLIKKKGLPSISKHYINFVAIDKFLNVFPSGKLKILKKHYDQAFATVPFTCN